MEIHLHRFKLLVNYISCRDLKLKMYEGFGAQRTFWKQTWWTWRRKNSENVACLYVPIGAVEYGKVENSNDDR